MRSEVRAYVALIGITLALFAFEKIGAYVTGSHALDADAWHVFGDSIPFAVGLIALVMRQTNKNPRVLERITSICNIVFLGWIAYWAGTKGVARLTHPTSIHAGALVLFSTLGLFGNILQLHFVHRTKHAHEETHTYQGQMWHIVSDLLTSVAVVSASILMLWKGWILADAVASLIVATVVAFFAILQTKQLCDSLTYSNTRGP